MKGANRVLGVMMVMWVGCSGGPSPVDGGIDAARPDAGIDAGATDAGRDAGPGPCVDDTACTDPGRPVCDVASGACVACSEGDRGACVAGQTCEGGTCVVGCDTDADCAAIGGAAMRCRTSDHTCVGCVSDDQCALGTICDAATSACIAGCTATRGCASASETCCDGTCAALDTSEAHCGACDRACLTGASCEAGACRDGCSGPLAFDVTPYATGATPQYVVLGDFDRDFDDDVVVTSTTSSLRIFRGDPSSTLTAMTDPPFGYGYGGIADLDRDGRLDLVASSGEVHLGNGDGTFRPGTGTSNYAAVGMAVADFDGDGRPDLARTNYGGNTLVVNLQTATGWGTERIVDTGMRPTGVRAADFDGDGDRDLLIHYQSDGHVRVLRNDGFATFTAGPNASVPLPQYAGVGDLDGDGDLDAVVSSYGPAELSILRNDGTGAFGTPTRITLPGLPIGLDVGDIDGDGDLDAVAADSANNAVLVLLGDGAGNLGAPTSYPAGGTMCLGASPSAT
jgi:hypothetical protein